ncbi:MAG: hypothetical protein ACI4SF_11390 [Oscillospiraceae bacterium]
MVLFKKVLAVLISSLMLCSVMAGCSSDKAELEDTYEGVLTKVRLGMPLNKVVSLNSGHDMYYETDTQIWCVNDDTDLMEIRDLIPADSGFYYADDSLITYNFTYNQADDTYYLNGYLEEVPCLISRETAESYYSSKIEQLKTKYSAAEAVSTITGTEDVDLTLDYVTRMTLSSFEVIFTMELTYDTVDAVDGYYGTYFCIEVKELANKTAVEVAEK